MSLIECREQHEHVHWDILYGNITRNGMSSTTLPGSFDVSWDNRSKQSNRHLIHMKTPIFFTTHFHVCHTQQGWTKFWEDVR